MAGGVGGGFLNDPRLFRDQLGSVPIRQGFRRKFRLRFGHRILRLRRRVQGVSVGFLFVEPRAGIRSRVAGHIFRERSRYFPGRRDAGEVIGEPHILFVQRRRRRREGRRVDPSLRLSRINLNLIFDLFLRIKPNLTGLLRRFPAVGRYQGPLEGSLDDEI